MAPIEERNPVAEQVPVQEAKEETRVVAPQMKKYNRDVQRFREMSRKLLHDPAVDAGAFGLNSWELQAAKVVALAGVRQGVEQGKVQPGDIDQEIRKNVRKVGNSQEFKDWAREAQRNPEKLRQLSRMALEEVRTDFVKDMSRNMEKQNDGPKREGPEKEGTKKDSVYKNVTKTKEIRKTPPKLQEPVRQGP